MMKLVENGYRIRPDLSLRQTNHPSASQGLHRVDSSSLGFRSSVFLGNLRPGPLEEFGTCKKVPIFFFGWEVFFLLKIHGPRNQELDVSEIFWQKICKDAFRKVSNNIDTNKKN